MSLTTAFEPLKLKILHLLVRIPGATEIWKRLNLGCPTLKVEFGIWDRPHYAYGVHFASLQAKHLGLPGISVIELGVAGGSGLVALEQHAAEISRETGVPIDVYGFDGGSGMPPPLDYRDLPHVWEQGFYKMDEGKLRAHLASAKLVVGEIGETLVSEATRFRYPVGFIAFDLDYYSSTKRAFNVFDLPPDTRLPRVYCYMDDVTWPERALHCKWIGELCAIEEFNEEHPNKKIAPINNLHGTRRVPAPWNDQFFALHDFEHPRYCVNITPKLDSHTELPLR